jgi:hypothetical protein
MIFIMGFSEYAVRINNEQELETLLENIKKHNDLSLQPCVCDLERCAPCSTGEELSLDVILKFQNKIYAVLCNSGGRDDTCEFLKTHYSALARADLLLPFDHKPVGWCDCNEYLWVLGNENENAHQIWSIIVKE